MEEGMFVIERMYNAPVSSVWRAITDKEQMKHWYFDLAEFKPEIGFEFQFYAGSDKKKYLHLCKITNVIEEKLLTYSWRYDEYAGNSSVTFELFEEGNQTRLKLTHKGLESFATDNPDFAEQSFAEGWSYLIGKALKEFLETAISA